MGGRLAGRLSLSEDEVITDQICTGFIQSHFAQSADQDCDDGAYIKLPAQENGSKSESMSFAQPHKCCCCYALSGGHIFQFESSGYENLKKKKSCKKYCRS